MPKLTDDQLGDLLRETFADHVDDLQILPEATKRRRFVPVLVAAAATVAVLGGGSIYATQRPAHEAPPVAGSPIGSVAAAVADDDVQIWSVVTAQVVEQKVPQTPRAAVFWPDAQISDGQRGEITETLSQSVQVSWVSPKPRHSPPLTQESTAYSSCLKLSSPIVFLGKVIDKGSYREVRVGISEACDRKESALYRLEKKNEVWTIVSRSAVTQTIS
ncbi:hypothetical protein E1263_37220 [Kribbella antibiotica]|uniref:Uncharacterized protein n=1 Tax=Kribbella antibiotica TaxID=190195 RepID=A0A4R4YMB4_9ACTN|nr:hypothetical protein [Kribbella antibiotica]TDD46106.1 hypothetical protein E1263_37220 [Kribbella antibiotica]